MSTHGDSLRDRLAERPQALPHPIATAAIYLCLAALSLGTGLAAGVAGLWVVTAVVSFVLAGLLHAGRSAAELARRRRTADSWLRTVSHCSPTSRYAWRAEELTSHRERRVLARSLRHIVSELRGRVLPGPVPLNRVGLRPYIRDLDILTSRLSDLERAVSPAGMLLVHDLLTAPTSPLYERERADELPDKIAAVLTSLEIA